MRFEGQCMMKKKTFLYYCTKYLQDNSTHHIADVYSSTTADLLSYKELTLHNLPSFNFSLSGLQSACKGLQIAVLTAAELVVTWVLQLITKPYWVAEQCFEHTALSAKQPNKAEKRNAVLKHSAFLQTMHSQCCSKTAVSTEWLIDYLPPTAKHDWHRRIAGYLHRPKVSGHLLHNFKWPHFIFLKLVLVDTLKKGKYKLLLGKHSQNFLLSLLSLLSLVSFVSCLLSCLIW